MKQYPVQQFEPQALQAVIGFVIALAVLAILIAQAIKAVKEVLK